MSLSLQNQRVIAAYKKGYRVINGQPYNPSGKKMTIMTSKSGYLVFSFYGRSMLLHRLVGYQKYGKKIFEKGMVCRHLDGNPLNAADYNIVLGTVSQNSMDKPKNVRIRLAVDASSKRRVFTDSEVSNIRKDQREGMTYKQLCEKYALLNK